MLWLVRFRPKESTTPDEFAQIDRYVASDVIPAFESVKGVLGARAFHSIHGEFVFVVELERTAVLDDVFRSKRMGEIGRGLGGWLVRVGGAELLWDLRLAAIEWPGAMTFN